MMRPVDMGIVKAVKILREEAHIATTESCEGGEGHCFPRPTVLFRGSPGEAWKAVGHLCSWSLPVLNFGSRWSFQYGLPYGPEWYVEFARSMEPG